MSTFMERLLAALGARGGPAGRSENLQQGLFAQVLGAVQMDQVERESGLRPVTFRTREMDAQRFPPLQDAGNGARYVGLGPERYAVKDAALGWVASAAPGEVTGDDVRPLTAYEVAYCEAQERAAAAMVDDLDPPVEVVDERGIAREEDRAQADAASAAVPDSGRTKP